VTSFGGNSKPAEQHQNKNDDQYEAKPAAAIVAGPVERPASDAAEASEQCDDQDDKQEGSE
jgi:hypothetical protein